MTPQIGAQQYSIPFAALCRAIYCTGAPFVKTPINSATAAMPMKIQRQISLFLMVFVMRRFVTASAAVIRSSRSSTRIIDVYRFISNISRPEDTFWAFVRPDSIIIPADFHRFFLLWLSPFLSGDAFFTKCSPNFHTFSSA